MRTGYIRGQRHDDRIQRRRETWGHDKAEDREMRTGYRGG